MLNFHRLVTKIYQHGGFMEIYLVVFRHFGCSEHGQGAPIFYGCSLLIQLKSSHEEKEYYTKADMVFFGHI